MNPFDELFGDLESDEGYLRAHAVNDFTLEVERRMALLGLTKADLARRLGSSRAYVTKMLGGHANFTVETMVRVAKALEARVHVHVEPGQCGERDGVSAWNTLAAAKVQVAATHIAPIWVGVGGDA